VQSTIPGARFAVIDFKDVTDRPLTNGVLILTPTFTSSCTDVQTAIDTMSASGGFDFPEAYNWVFHNAYSEATLDASRNSNAAVNAGSDLSGTIIGQIQAAAAHITSVNLVVSGACPPVGLTFSPAPPYGPFTAPVDIQFDETISVGLLAPGVYSCGVTAVVDGTPRAVQHVNVTVGFPESTAGCRLNYGGTITSMNGDAATFGGNAKADGLKGEEEYQDHGPLADINVHSIDVRAVVCNAAGTTASIFGLATVDGGGRVQYRIDVADNGEPGRNDTYRIRLSNGYDSGVQKLSAGGNVQIH
jgi:hypothetical protein